MKNSKVALPVLVVVAVAVTVSIALGASGNRHVDDPGQEESSSASEEQSGDLEEVPLVENEDGAIRELIYTYYNAQALGDVETLRGLCDEFSSLDELRITELSKYIEYYPALEIYTQKGLNEGETIVYVYYKMTFVNHEEEFPGYTADYVCTAEDGSLYIKNSKAGDDLDQYMQRVCQQSDVQEFNNRVKAEYDAFKEAYPELASYADEVKAQVNETVGERLSDLQTASENTVSEGDTQPEGGEGEPPEETPEETGPMYAVATTTVNVRSSDSEQADRLGKVSGGTRLEVVEQRVNGWSEVVFENKKGYIKSEFLRMEESAAGLETIGKVKATTNVNVRAAASETADKLGVLTGGDTADLFAVEGDWCKIKYNGQVAYVKTDYVEQQ
ncbi:MAG: SH3 domain-containing protein [Butyrivibrio sp.]|nr:SH3 domain-containing protein [Muribaculum sp.]MCM1553629.1 SH3 domain-containing protein [Butyrivibrio sp.]